MASPAIDKRWSATLLVPLLLVTALLVSFAVFPRSSFLADVNSGILENLGWVYLASMSAFVVFALLIGFSSFGKQKLGPDDSKPEYSRRRWFAMLLSAGTGVQLMYASVSEPLLLAAAPPFGRAGPQEEYPNAMSIAMFHWGLHPWAVVTVVALCIGYFSHCQGLPLRLSSAFHPLLGERVHGRAGEFINGIATLSTMLVAISGLTLASSAVAAGLNSVWLDAPQTLAAEFTALLALSLAATYSVVLGIRKGIRPLSELTLFSAGALLLFVLLAGQSLQLATNFFDNLWTYLRYLPANARELGVAANASEARWLARWTLPYWAWWIAWAPCVGTFIAKLSRGRTIREVVIFALICPALCTSAWLSVFGNSAFYEQEYGQGMMKFAASSAQEGAVFELLAALPWETLGFLLTFLCMLLFAITSTSAASLVVAEHSSDKQRGTWWRAAVAGAAGIAATLTLSFGGAASLGTAAHVMALPICALLLVMCFCLFRALVGTRSSRLLVLEARQD